MDNEGFVASLNVYVSQDNEDEIAVSFEIVVLHRIFFFCFPKINSQNVICIVSDLIKILIHCQKYVCTCDLFSSLNFYNEFFVV